MADHSEKPGHGETFFAVLPDREAALAVARRLNAPDPRTVTYASGRPWLVGSWADGEVTAVHAGDVRLAVVGQCAVDPDLLTRRAARLTDLSDLSRLARSLPGSFHLVAALGGRLRVQGSASGLRLVFHARVDDVTVAADRADVLAELTGADLDQTRLAARLLWPVPHPIEVTPVWRGVHGVEPGHHLTVDADGRTARTGRWWAPPRPERPLADAADDIRAALADAVDARTRGGGTVSCDLSGGLDSTSVCALAARGPAHVVASTWPGLDPADEDLEWARRAAAHLPDVEHVVWPVERSPLVYAGLPDIDDVLDEPTIGVMDHARVLSHVPALAAKGSRLHLTGIGGDHVAWCSEAHYHRLLRRRPLLAARRLRGFRALFTWSPGPMAVALADTRSYGRWLADAAADLRRPEPSPVIGALGWGAPPRMFDWVTPDAARAVAALLRRTAATARPLAPDRGAHADLAAIHATTRIVRQWDRACDRAGLPAAHPFFDDRVIEAFLAVRPEDRVTPWRYKPSLVAAMRGVVPDVCLARTNKATAATDAVQGLRRHAAELDALWESSRLARLGLVDADRLRALTGRPDDPRLRGPILYSTLACEVWLRARSRVKET
ncbi:lasso peptide isopeptide bond-forming cyclase [Actinomadura kijaniata]|uniref:asparagine synthase (glutamine-hydrolyzing) n=1 Tax=Actinomadura namibiensis TaxID=182080 RepID=A0A7W3LN42_ACTNM|nr:lasso peptide isopeptide bond-forming cyclase [Actinomadura namibiensis]MBA8951159.1 asparagine synthase (glutamine-hydrolyzing) [Actinomadura namibiensis]